MENTGKTLFDFQEDWEKLVDKAYDDFSSLTRPERIWFTIQVLIDSINDGGVASYYYNNGADWVMEAIEDLDYLGFPILSNRLKEINSRFPNGVVPDNVDDRNDIIADWSDDFLDKTDEEFYEQEQILEAKLVAHIEATLTQS